MAENEEATESVSQGSSAKKMLMLGAAVFLIIAGAFGVYISGMADSFFSFSSPLSSEEEEDDEAPKNDLLFYEVPEMLINLSVRPGQKPIYFKIKVVLELAAPEDSAKVEKLLPRVVDSLQFYLREMRLEELQGSMGTYRLKEELMGRLNKVLAPVKINDVLLKDILIQ